MYVTVPLCALCDQANPNVSLLPSMVQQKPEQQTTTNLPGQHEITAVAAHEMLKQSISVVPPHPAPCFRTTHTEPAMVPKMALYQKMFQQEFNDVILEMKKAHEYYSYL